MSNLKLQKVLYFIQAKFLVETINHRQAFSDVIEAWDIGVVVPKVFHQYLYYGNLVIPKQKIYHNINYCDRELIDDMVDELNPYSAVQLTELTLKQAPWQNAYIKGYGEEISNKSIYKFFKLPNMKGA